MSKTMKGTPKHDGFRMPGEFEPHQGTWMLWPERTDTWRLGAKPAQKTFIDIAVAISTFEPVTLCATANQYEHVREVVPDSIRVVEISSNDAWMRDIGPTFVKNDRGDVRGIDWGFNAWGGLEKGLYFPWHMDTFVKQKVMEMEHIHRYDAQDFILEGGAIAVDGEGTVITTEQCLLNKNRNPHLSKEEVEKKLKDYLNVEKIIWLKNGMLYDETDGHVDEVIFFVRPGVVALSWTDDENDPQYKVLNDVYEQLKNIRDAKGRPLEIHKIQIPAQIEMTENDSDGIDAARGAYGRQPGTKLAATYVNCYICNGGVIVPAFNDPQDQMALEQIQLLFPDRKAVQVNTREVALGGGNIHCITQQQPKA
ncbi:agmatine deiminase [Scopulibacillus darangshiensis]|uniref:Putative agmatine deiminase n=1 Tax=Scopulibacillus darangshiensis TaxID=442528 RepID=A0A4V2SNB7_9BACL|nr:agmatine deiminase [Scopulibacillus darangshiensis]TCP30616.1 agmatine deiminase [Scopulibacillus darangshiensis]